MHELAVQLKITEEEVLEGLESANAYSTLSLDVPDTDDDSPAVADTLGAMDEALEGVEYRESLKPLLESLPPREKKILMLRFFGNMTQSQIAAELGISQMHVSRLLARTLTQLRDGLTTEELGRAFSEAGARSAPAGTTAMSHRGGPGCHTGHDTLTSPGEAAVHAAVMANDAAPAGQSLPPGASAGG